MNVNTCRGSLLKKAQLFFVNFSILISFLFSQQNIKVLSGDQKTDMVSTLNIFQREQIVISPTKREADIKKMPFRTTVVSRGELINQPVTNIEEALSYISGAGYVQFTGLAEYRPVITLRGLGGFEQSRTLVLLDGNPLNISDTGDVNWRALDWQNVERIEVIKGPVSSLYGNNAMGGAINIITKKPDRKLSADLGLSYGSFNSVGESIEVSFREKELNGNKFFGQIKDAAEKDLKKNNYQYVKIDFTTSENMDEKINVYQMTFQEKNVLIYVNNVFLPLLNNKIINKTISISSIEKLEVFKPNTGAGELITYVNIKTSTENFNKLAVYLQENGKVGEDKPDKFDIVLTEKIGFVQGYYGRFFWKNFNSDGYVSTPQDQKTKYTTNRYVRLNNHNLKLGYDFSDKSNLEIYYSKSRDWFGDGEKIYSAQGKYVYFDDDYYSFAYRKPIRNGELSFSAFSHLLHYLRIDEKFNNAGIYSRFDVDAQRLDYGSLLHCNIFVSKNHTLGFGLEGKVGSIDGADIYKTSDERVENKGKLSIISTYFQDEYYIGRNYLLVSGLRYDSAYFSEGFFNAKYAPLNTYNNDDIPRTSWTHLSPRFSFSLLADRDRLFFSYAQGFRASILDDLCRTGWFQSGPKEINPDLKPEIIDTYEIGADKNFDKLALNASVFLSKGRDFMYYIDTGKKLFGTTLYKRENVSSVVINGFEWDSVYTVEKDLFLRSGFTYSRSIISNFPEKDELEGKLLTFTPEFKATIGLEKMAEIINAAIYAVHNSFQYVDDINSEVIPSYLSVNAKFWKNILSEDCTASLLIQNILNYRYIFTYSRGTYIAAERSFMFNLNYKLF